MSENGSDIAKILDTICKLNEINRTAAERIVSIVTSLRTFARLDQADMDRVDIHEGIDSTLTLVGHELKGRITVVKEYGDLPDVVCYPNQLNQVFMNILVNGAQAIDGKGNITIRTSRRGEQVVVEFIDSGKGISPEHLYKLFDPGFTTKGVGVGTGLGLSIVHQIVRGHGGELQVESEPGKGATFRIVLPVERQ